MSEKISSGVWLVLHNTPSHISRETQGFVEILACCDAGHIVCTEAEGHANARLMAASKDMYAVLSKIRRYDIADGADPLWDEIQAVLRKANP